MISRTGKYRLFPIAGYAATISAVFLIAVPVAALSILATWIIPQVELRQWPEDGPPLRPGRHCPATRRLGSPRRSRR